MAYQGYGRGIDLAVVESLNKVVIGNHWPDLTVLIDIDPVLSLGRARDRNRNDTVDEGRFEKESLDFFARVRHGYLEIARRSTDGPIVSGEQPVETLHREIVGLLIQTHSTEFQTGFR